jgi:hypothetical protein
MKNVPQSPSEQKCVAIIAAEKFLNDMKSPVDFLLSTTEALNALYLYWHKNEGPREYELVQDTNTTHYTLLHFIDNVFVEWMQAAPDNVINDLADAFLETYASFGTGQVAKTVDELFAAYEWIERKYSDTLNSYMFLRGMLNLVHRLEPLDDLAMRDAEDCSPLKKAS